MESKINPSSAPASSAALGLNDSNFARKSQQLIQLANRLRDVGAALNVPLPGIVFAGNQVN